MQIFSGRIF